MKIILINAAQERRIIVAPGTELEKDDAEARSMIARGIARAKESEPPAANAPGEGAGNGQPGSDEGGTLTDEDREAFAKLNKADALGYIADVVSLPPATWQQLLDIEQAREKPRADVLAAIGAKLFPPVQD